MITSKRWQKIFIYLLFLLLFLFGVISCKKSKFPKPGAVSEFGKYNGYSEEKYDSWKRTSQYIEMKDGIKLAMDIIRPVQNDQVVEEELPVVWAYYRYHRAVEIDGKVLSLVDRLPPLQTLIKHGYVIVVVDARGSGASFGDESKGPNTLQEAQHTYEITEWIAAQEWCDGKVGMFGHSYSGNIQFLAAAQAPPHLKAVFPSGVTFDLYEIVYPGGVFSENLAKGISSALHYWDIEVDAVPIDSDSSRKLLKQTKLERLKRVNPYDFFKAQPYRDSQYKEYSFWLQGNPLTYLSACNVSKIPVYQWIGWQDFLIRDAFQWFVNLKSPQKLSVGWWSHDIRSSHVLLAIEQLRWFDYWLKGIDNGIMDEPPIHYTCIDDTGATAWHQAKTWPLPESQPRVFYFALAGSDSTQLKYNSLLLTKSSLKERQQKDVLFPNCKELTFFTPPLEKDLFVIGHPVVRLYLTTMARNVDMYITLKDVDESNNTSQVTTGTLRASHRSITKPPFNNMKLPYQRHYAEDLIIITNRKSVELRFDLLPVAKCFKSGHRIQISVAYAEIFGSAENRSEVLPEMVLSGMSLMKSNIILPIVKQ